MSGSAVVCAAMGFTLACGDVAGGTMECFIANCDKMCFLAPGSGTCPQRAVLGLFILMPESGSSRVAGQTRLRSVAEK